MNRGIARRTVFESARDVRYFLSRLARAVRAGQIELHAYCIMTTHFHMLVRSTGGELSVAMARVQNDYVRWFNRGRRRDGSLFRGRFRSLPVDSMEYRRRLVRYIDDNPVLAGVVPAPEMYPHSSARHYARARGPLWLERSWIEGQVRARTEGSQFDPAHYGRAFGPTTTSEVARILERRISGGVRNPDPLDDLLGAAPERVLEWMRHKASLADGTEIDVPLCAARDVARVIADLRFTRQVWPIAISRQTCCGWRLLEVALLRDLSAITWSEIGSALSIARHTAARAYRVHERALHENATYAETAALAAGRALEACYGMRASVGGTVDSAYVETDGLTRRA
ncbi:MAG: transposase [Planctomycetes bacterium]|nr:transposase [Planctomycetota bacterium]